MYSTASEPGLRRSFQLFMCLYWNYKALGNFYQIYISRFISMESPAMCLTIMIHILCLRTDISWKLPYAGLKYIFHGNSEEACYTEDAENSKGLQNKLSYSLRQKWLGHFNQTLFFPSRAPLVPLKVVQGGSVTKSCTPTLRGQGDPKVSQPFWLWL